MSADTTLVRKLHDRRKAMRESTMEMASLQDSSIEDIADSTERMEELQHAEDLIQKLTVGREEKRRELSVALEPLDESPPTTKPRKKQRRPEPLAGDEEGDDTIPTIPTIPDTDGESDQETARSSRSTKKASSFAMAALKVSGKETGTLNASIQERIKRRILEAKQKAEQTIKDEVQKDPDKDLPGRRLRGLRARDLATRFDEPSLLTKEELEEDKQLQESIAAKSKWKATFKAVKKKESDLPTAEEAYDFFTRPFEPEAPEPVAVALTSAEADAIEPVPEDEDAGKSLLAAHFINEEDYLLFPAEMKGPEYLPLRVREENEDGYYFVPASTPGKLLLCIL